MSLDLRTNTLSFLKKKIEEGVKTIDTVINMETELHVDVVNSHDIKLNFNMTELKLILTALKKLDKKDVRNVI